MRTSVSRGSCILLVSLSPFLLVCSTPARADIYQWEYINPADPSQGKQQSTTLAPDGAGVDAVPGADLIGRDLSMAYLVGADLTNAYGPANLTNADLSQANLTNASFSLATLTGAEFSGAEIRGADFGLFTYYSTLGTGISLQQLYSTASYQAKDLTGVGFDENALAGANFVGQNLTDASFYLASLNLADFTGAVIRGANFGRLSFNISYFTGIRLEQLYSTASYHVGDLSGIDFTYNFLYGGNFAGQNLTNTNFYGATLTAADFTAADTRGANLDSRSGPGAGGNSIGTDGHIAGVDLHDGGLLIVRDYDGDPYISVPPIPITVDQHLTMAPGGTLRMVFEADAWDSTISFAPGIPVTLGGTLELTFADDVNLASQLGRTLQIFDWTGVTPTGAFAISSPYRWDTSNLYTTGQITLTAIPEPSALVLSLLGLFGLAARTRRPQSNESTGGSRASSGFNSRRNANDRLSTLIQISADECGLAFPSFSAASANSCSKLKGRTLHLPERFLQFAAALFALVGLTASAHADIYQWEYINPADASQGKQQSTTLAPDGAGVDAVPAATMIERDLTMAYLIGADLRNAAFLRCTLTDADFTGAKIQGASFSRFSFSGPQGTGIALAQLYSTASYEARDLNRTSFFLNDLAGGNFTGQNLANSSFPGTNLDGADFTGADTRGAFVPFDDWNVITTNLIRPDGHIDGLDLDGGRRLDVRDYDGNPAASLAPIPITIDQHLAIAPGGTLQMLFEADAWDSTISFAPGIPVTRGGTLELSFADGVNVASQLGRTLKIFDWTGVTPTGAFAVSSPYDWDTSQLYTTGQITLTALPEPSACALAAIGFCGFVACVRRRP
jgi:uncharacterized protein YjbI with pentapeptide repeats